MKKEIIKKTEPDPYLEEQEKLIKSFEKKKSSDKESEEKNITKNNKDMLQIQKEKDRMYQEPKSEMMIRTSANVRREDDVARRQPSENDCEDDKERSVKISYYDQEIEHIKKDIGIDNESYAAKARNKDKASERCQLPHSATVRNNIPDRVDLLAGNDPWKFVNPAVTEGTEQSTKFNKEIEFSKNFEQQINYENKRNSSDPSYKASELHPNKESSVQHSSLEYQHQDTHAKQPFHLKNIYEPGKNTTLF